MYIFIGRKIISEYRNVDIDIGNDILKFLFISNLDTLENFYLDTFLLCLYWLNERVKCKLGEMS